MPFQTRRARPVPLQGADGRPRTDAAGRVLAIPPSHVVQELGPRIQVVLSLPTFVEEGLVASGVAVPAPLVAEALIDTGASVTCIDDDLARRLQLPVIDRMTMTSASHAAHPANVYPIRVEFTGLGLERTVNKAMGAVLAPQGVQMLIGRDLLAEAVFIYNGREGEFTIGF